MKMETPKEKFMIYKIRKNLEKMNNNNLDYMKDKEKRIFKREKEIEYLDSLFKPAPITIMSNRILKSSLKKKFSKTKDTFYKTVNSKFNLGKIKTIPNNNINTYNRMKKYRVLLKKKKYVKPEDKIKMFLNQSGFLYIPRINQYEEENKILNKENEKENNNNEKNNNDNKNKNEKTKDNIIFNSLKNKNDGKINIKIENNNLYDEKINSNRMKNQELNRKFKNKKMDFEYYLKMQSRAEIKLKPKIGDESNDLVNYINAIQGIREKLIIDILSEINKTENRYNQEKPEVDANFVVKDKGLNVHKWKNIFYLKDYQKYYLDGLKGKISVGNYKQMLRKFRQIQSKCFSEGKTQFQVIKKINFAE